MRDKNLLHLLLVLNGALAACFLVYLLLASSSQPKFTTASFATLPTVTNRLPTKAAPTESSTNVAAALKATNEPAAPPPTLTITNESVPQPVFTQKKFGWQQVESEEYESYLDSLRSVGCPEEKVRYIIMADINELAAHKRLKEAVDHDLQWWRAEPELTIANVLQEKGRKLEAERRALIEKLLGKEALELDKSEMVFWSNVQLTGPVLGSLPTEVHQTVQDICGRSIERTQNAFWARVNDGQSINQVEQAKLREQTRADLRKVLDAAALEEFLLRYSHNAHELRAQLRGFEATPDEFRKIFRAIDPIQHQLQLEYGGLEALSPQQRERYERQRDAAIKEALGPRRYDEYLVTKDPLYRQAQMTAMQYGAPAKAIMPIYEMTKLSEQKRQKILSDGSLTAQQKTDALNTVNQEQLKSMQRIVSDAANQK
jgi:hypothetical protein